MSSDYHYEISISWSDEDGCFIAVVPELPGCMADGPTYRKALAAAEQAIGLWIDAATELGRVIPKPRGAHRLLV